MPKTSQPALLLDASITIFQYYFSMPDNWFSVEEDFPTAAVYGYTTFLLRLLEQETPRRIAACFDESLGSCFRNQLYPNYKISRPPADEALAFQLRACREVSELFGIASFASDRYEADDLLGTLVRKLSRGKAPIAILTRDKDLGQLLKRDQDFLWDYAKGDRLHRPHIKAKFGVHPEQLVDYLALVGDSIDDIPGVPGLGPKTAAALLGRFDNIDHIFKQLPNVAELSIRGAGKLPDKLAEFHEQILLSRQLATIIDTVELGVSSRDLAWPPTALDYSALEDFCWRMGFPRLYTRVVKVLEAL